MAAIVAYAYGPTSQLCLYILMCVGAEGALLSQKRKNILFFIPLILIAAEMIGYKLYPQYLEYVTIVGEALALLLMMMLAVPLAICVYYNAWPPETFRTWPVSIWGCSLERNRMVSAMSSG